MIIFLISTFIGFLTILHIYTHYSRKGLLVNKIPGPKGYPVVGNVFLIVNKFMKLKSLGELWDYLRQLFVDHYGICKFWLFHVPIIGIHHPRDIEILLTSPHALEKDLPYKHFRNWLKTGLLTSNGDKWKQRKKLLTRPFHYSLLSKNVTAVNDHSCRLIKYLRSQGKESVQSVLEAFTKCTMNITADAIMDVDMDKIDGKTADNYREAAHTMTRMIVVRTLSPFLQDWMLNSYTKFGRLYLKTIKILHDFTNKIVNERRDYHKRNDDNINVLNESPEEIGIKKKLPMLDFLLTAEKDGLIDDEGIKEEVDTFLLGGTDTSQTVIAYACLVLAEHKEIQDRIRAEIMPVLNNSKGEVGASELNQFSYLERCIKEVMRLYPPVPLLFRYTTGDVQLQNYTIPAGVNILVSVHETHRDPNIWPDPEKFDPDRFLPEETQKRHSFAWLPFSAGPRNCIGQKFGMMILKSVLAQLLYNFKLEPVTPSKNLRMILDVMLHPSERIFVKFCRIDKADL